ncbi:MAG: ATP-binding protein [Planctomycetes bacterium]|nr:ATP-binding protein [Planctomycetota bacterium]MCB9889410.1 ATP-binding protein [Planctomycetota bacterium]
MKELFDRRMPADLSGMRDLRAMLRRELGKHGVPELFMERLVLVVDEVVSNAIEHGVDYRCSETPIRVCVQQSEAGLFLLVDDTDVPRRTVDELVAEFGQQGETPAAALERGRGMFLVATFLVDLDIRWADGGGMRLQGRLQESRD